MDLLQKTLAELADTRLSGIQFPHSGDFILHAGYEVRNVPGEYRWDGTKRGGDPAHPYIIFQYTLDGWGVYSTQDSVKRVNPGTAFIAVIPSEHVYYLPRQSQSWSFVFVILRHPYIVSRLCQLQEATGPVFSIEKDDAVVTRLVQLVEGFYLANYRDKWALEAAMFDFLMECERHAERLLYPRDRSAMLLDEIRRYVLGHPGHLVDVSEVAEAMGMSRSHFSHQFKDRTGISPAEWIRQVALEEVTRRLRETDDKLEAIAAAIGFSDANHLCKVFRRRYHLSPGSYRRQMR